MGSRCPGVKDGLLLQSTTYRAVIEVEVPRTASGTVFPPLAASGPPDPFLGLFFGCLMVVKQPAPTSGGRAKLAGVDEDKERVVFAPLVGKEEHLRRLRLR